MSTFAITDQNEVIEAVNYAISNLGAQTGVLAGNALTVNTTTNAVTVGVGGEVYAYNVQYINIRYANTATGSNGFTSAPTNSYYYGVQATANAVPATLENPASYTWNQVPAPGFSTTNFLWYSTPGGRQITFAVTPIAPNDGFQETQNNVAIDLDFVTTIAANAVTANSIANGTITGSQIAGNTITGFNIQTGTIMGSDIAANTITANNITNSTITGGKIATQTITATNIANSTITGQQIASNVTLGNVTANYFIGNGSLLTNINAGNISGNVSSAVTAGTVTTNAQPNITSVGTLSSLSVTGNVTASILLQTGNIVRLSTNGDASATTANTISIGLSSGNTGQLTGAIAIGELSGNANQGSYAIALGRFTGRVTQGDSALAIGRGAGNITQGANAIAIGRNAGNNAQGSGAIAIGRSAGNTTQGANAIAIGWLAGSTNQPANSVIISGGNLGLDGSNEGFYINPVRTDTANIANVIFYNTTSKELTYASSISLTGNVQAGSFVNAPVALASLTAVNGARAFVNNANLVAANNFGQQISGGGSNTVPVWSNGTNWFIG